VLAAPGRPMGSVSWYSWNRSSKQNLRAPLTLTSLSLVFSHPCMRWHCRTIRFNVFHDESFESSVTVAVIWSSDGEAVAVIWRVRRQVAMRRSSRSASPCVHCRPTGDLFCFLELVLWWTVRHFLELICERTWTVCGLIVTGSVHPRGCGTSFGPCSSGDTAYQHSSRACAKIEGYSICATWTILFQRNISLGAVLRATCIYSPGFTQGNLLPTFTLTALLVWRVFT
jgi:hypothetical protein